MGVKVGPDFVPLLLVVCMNLLVLVLVGDHLLHRVHLLLVLVVVLIDLFVPVVVGDLILHSVELLLDNVLLIFFVLVDLLFLEVVGTLLLHGINLVLVSFLRLLHYFYLTFNFFVYGFATSLPLVFFLVFFFFVS